MRGPNNGMQEAALRVGNKGGTMKGVESQFNEYFAAWKIFLPSDDLANRRRGSILQAGWSIWYLFGSGEGGEFLDFYASHRMTNDRHVRLHENGASEELPAIMEFRRCSSDPVEDKRLEAEYFAENNRISALHEKKWSTMT